MKPTHDQWDIARTEQIMEAGVKAKFRQDEELKTELLSTSSKAFVECNVYDRLWGTGLIITNEDASKKAKWKGQNLMGTVLINVRGALK